MAQNDECGGSQSTKFIKIWISEKNFKILKKKKKILQDISQMTSNMAHTKRGEVLPENIWLTKVAPHTELNLLS